MTDRQMPKSLTDEELADLFAWMRERGASEVVIRMLQAELAKEAKQP